MNEEGGSPSESENPIGKKADASVVKSALEFLAEHSGEVASVSDAQDAKIKTAPVAKVGGTNELVAAPDNDAGECVPAKVPLDLSTADHVTRVERLQPSAVVEVGISMGVGAYVQDAGIEKKPVTEGHTAERQDVVEGAGEVSTDKVSGAYIEQVNEKKGAAYDTVKGDNHAVQRKAEGEASSLPAEIFPDERGDNSDGHGSFFYNYDDRFGKILQLSQWSLTRRIEACERLESSTERWRMTALSRHEYAKQCLALTETVTDSEESSSLPSFEWSDIDWQSKMKELEDKVEGSIYQDWNALTGKLKAKLKRLREEDATKGWYTSFTEAKLEPKTVFEAVEKGRADVFKALMSSIPVQHWAFGPGEYGGATILHWAALHGRLGIVSALQDVVDSEVKKLPVSEKMFNERFDVLDNLTKSWFTPDDLGFTPLYLAIFSSLWPSFDAESSDDMEQKKTAESCSQMIDSLYRMFVMSRNKGGIGENGDLKLTVYNAEIIVSNFLIFDPIDRDISIFVAKDYLSGQIFPIQLAIWSAHPIIIEKLMGILKEAAFVETCDGDTILHLAAWGRYKWDADGRYVYDEVAALVLRYLHFFPSVLNVWNNAGQTPLHIAVFQGNTQCVAALLRCHYIKVNLENNLKFTPRQIATRLKEDVCTIAGRARRFYSMRLGREDVDGMVFGISTLKYNYMVCNEYRRTPHDVIITEIINLINELDPEIHRHRELLQISQWSLKHRMMAFHMISEETQSEIITQEVLSKLDKYGEKFNKQCQNLVDSKQGDNGDLPLAVRLQREFEKGSGLDKIFFNQLWGIYIAVEEGDMYDFKRLMGKLPKEHWLTSLHVYKGATPLHWAALHGRREMVSFIWQGIRPSREQLLKSEVHKTWCDGFGFTPLHLAMFSSFSTSKYPASPEKAKNCSLMIKDLHQMGVPHCSQFNPKQDNLMGAPHCSQVDPQHDHLQVKFLAWNLSDSIEEDYLSDTEFYPVHLAIWYGHLSLVKRLTELWPESAFVETSFKDTNFHLAAWCDPSGKVIRNLLKYLYLSPDVVNSLNTDKNSPLHIAVANQSQENVKALLSWHLIKDNKNSKEHTARELAKMRLLPERRLFAKTDWADIGMSRIALGHYDKQEPVHENRRISNSSWGIVQLFTNLDDEVVRQKKILQISQWSLKHTMIAFEMIQKDQNRFKDIKENYEARCRDYLSDSAKIPYSGDIAKGLNDKYMALRDEHDLSEWQRGCGEKGIVSGENYKQMQDIYEAIESSDVDEFKRLMQLIPVELWAFKPKRLRGATALHWAALHGQKEMVSFIWINLKSLGQVPAEAKSGMINLQVFDAREADMIKSQIVDAEDDFGFTPLHLAVFSSFSTLKYLASYQKAQTCSEIIEELHQMDATSRANKDSTSSFITWNLKDNIYADDSMSHPVQPIHLAICFGHSLVVEKLLERWSVTTSSGDTILHNARAWSVLIEDRKELLTVLLKHLNNSQEAVNSLNDYRQTPLHSAVLNKNPEWVEVLLRCKHINVNLRDSKGHTPRELAVEQSGDSTLTSHDHKNNGEDRIRKQIIELIDCLNPDGLTRETDALQKERQVYVDAANAILVGAALIASASFGAWLAPPLGLQPYYSDEFLVIGTGTSDTYESFVAIKQYWVIHLFWIFNSLSFFFSLATVIAGADAALPQQGLNLRDAVESVRNAVKRATGLLSVAIVFAVGTFTTIGFAILPPIEKYMINMYCTVSIGLIVCGYVLLRLLFKLSGIQPGLCTSPFSYIWVPFRNCMRLANDIKLRAEQGSATAVDPAQSPVPSTATALKSAGSEVSPPRPKLPAPGPPAPRVSLEIVEVASLEPQR